MQCAAAMNTHIHEMCITPCLKIVPNKETVSSSWSNICYKLAAHLIY